jgi:hypothetical protein
MHGCVLLLLTRSYSRRHQANPCLPPICLTVCAEHGALEAAPRAQQLPLDLIAYAADLLSNQRHHVAILIVHGELGGLLKAQDDCAPAGSRQKHRKNT